MRAHRSVVDILDGRRVTNGAFFQGIHQLWNALRPFDASITARRDKHNVIALCVRAWDDLAFQSSCLFERGVVSLTGRVSNPA